jgi:hypothetical protein
MIFFRLLKIAQTQVEPCEIPFAGVLEILRPYELPNDAYLK